VDDSLFRRIAPCSRSIRTSYGLLAVAPKEVLAILPQPNPPLPEKKCVMVRRDKWVAARFLIEATARVEVVFSRAGVVRMTGRANTPYTIYEWTIAPDT